MICPCGKPLQRGKLCRSCWREKAREAARAHSREQNAISRARLAETKLARQSWARCQVGDCGNRAESAHARWCSGHRPGQRPPRAEDYLRRSVDPMEGA